MHSTCYKTQLHSSTLPGTAVLSLSSIGWMTLKLLAGNL